MALHHRRYSILVSIILLVTLIISLSSICIPKEEQTVCFEGPRSLSSKCIGTIFNNQYYVGFEDVGKYMETVKKARMGTIMLYYNHNFSSTQQSLLCSLIYYCNTNNIDVILSYNPVPDLHKDSIGTISLEQWKDDIATMVSLFDGKTEHVLNGVKTTLQVDYFTIMEELDLTKERYGLSYEDLLYLFKTSYDIVKINNPNAKVLSSLISHYDDSYFKGLLHARLPNGTKYVNTCDILFFDTYGDPEAIITILNKIKSAFAKYQEECLIKPIWNCTGDSRWNHSDEYVSNRIVRHALCSFAVGADRYINYKLVSYGGNLTSSGYSSYFGLLNPSVDNSYISFLRNDDSRLPLSDGIGSEKVYIGYPPIQSKLCPGYVYHEVDSYAMCERLQQNGLLLICDNASISKITISKLNIPTSREICIYENTDFNSLDRIVIPSYLFNNIKRNDYIKVYYKNANTSNRIRRVEKTLAYKKLSFLSQISNGQFDQFIVIKNKGLWIAEWKDSSSYYYALWSHTKQNLTIDDKKITTYNSLGDKNSVANNKGIMVEEDVIYLVSKQRLLSLINCK